MKFLIFKPLFFIVLALLAGCEKKFVCTEEFRTYSVVALRADGIPFFPTQFYLIQGADTLLTRETYEHPDWMENSIMIFNDNNMVHTDTKGKIFRFTGYSDGAMLFDEEYVFKHDNCHVIKVSGKEVIQIP